MAGDVLVVPDALERVHLMSNEWFYSRDGIRFGPISKQQVVLLAARGELRSTDLLWKSGTTAWVPAGDFKGLIRESAEVARTDVEPVPDVKSNEHLAAREESSVRPDASEASITAPMTLTSMEAVQEIRFELVTVILPQAYRDLGRRLKATEAMAGEFPDLYRHLNQLTSSLASFEAVDATRPKFMAEAMLAVGRVDREQSTAQQQSLQLRIDKILEHLGEAAFKKHGDNSGPSVMVQAIRDARAKLIAIDSQIANKSPRSRRSRFLSVKALLFGGIFTALLIALMFFFVMQ